MKLKKIFLPSGFILSICLSASGQIATIAGNWQLVKQSNCLEQTGDLQSDSLRDLRDEMHNYSGAPATTQVVRFKENSSGEESSRIMESRKSANSKKFLYKFNGQMLFILDKKSQTISDSYVVDKFSSDSLVISNASRPCETKIFLKINEARAN